MGVRDAVGSASRSAEDSRFFRALARGGYVASGIVHVLVGVLMLALAFTGSGATDQGSALDRLASTPIGALVPAVLAVLLMALGLFHVVVSFARLRSGISAAASGPTVTHQRRVWGERLSHWGQAAGFLSLGGVALFASFGGHSTAEADAENASRGVLDLWGGAALLSVVGLGIIVGGVVFAVLGLRRSFDKQLTIPSGTLGTAVRALGVVGYVAKGLAVAAVGGLICVAAIENDPESAGALDSAMRLLNDLPGGTIMVTIMGAGFIAYGLFCGFRARYADL